MPPTTPSIPLSSPSHGLTMLIFDDALYRCEALRLPDHQHEDDLDAHLVARAKQYSTTSTPSTPSTTLTTLTTSPAMDDASAATAHRDSIASNSSAAHSVLSSSSSLQTSTPRKKRASALFSLFRKDSALHSACPSPSHDQHHARPRASKSVLTADEADRVLGGAAQSPEIGSLRDSGYSESGMSSIELSRSLKRISLSTASKSTPSTPLRRSSSGQSPATEEAWASFRAQQKEQFERVAAFECNQRKALSAHHQFSLKRLAEQHESSKKERKEQVCA